MSTLVERAIRDAGLEDVIEARARGDFARVRSLLSASRFDLLALGALADRIRQEEVGPRVRVHCHTKPAGAVRASADFLRDVATARIADVPGASVRIDWDEVGLELAQVALGFGADELCGTITSKRGLPIAADAMSGAGKKSARVSMLEQKRRELESVIARSGRTAVFVEGAAA